MNLVVHAEIEAPCPVCHSTSPLEESFSQVNLHRCPTCDHFFSRIDSEHSFKNYGEEYYDLSYYEHPNIHYFKLIENFIRRDQPCASVIDLGCGKGHFLKYIHHKFPELNLSGLDLSPNPPKSGIEFIQGNIFETKLDRQFSMVTSLNSIEHVSDIQSFLKRMIDFCLPKGYIVITTINERAVIYEVARWLNKLGLKGPFQRLYHPHHVNHLNLSSLNRLICENGLTPKKKFKHDLPVKAIELNTSAQAYPKKVSQSYLGVKFLQLGVFGMFLLGRLMGRTFQQTIIAQK